MPPVPDVSTDFSTRLRTRIAETGTTLCVGIDPHLSALPPFFRKELEKHGAPAFLERFSFALVDAAAGVVPAVKPQSAFFEAHGSAGFAVLERVMARAREKGLLTVLDAKRGDIASTMAAYGEMAFDVMHADALTVTPYMGLDVMQPLLPWLEKGRGIYLVWVSSNPGGALVQDALAAPLLRAFTQAFAAAGVSGALGLVLGATKVDALDPALRAQLGAVSLLMPGVGAQGGVVTPLLKALIRANGAVLVPQSRSLAGFPEGCETWEEFAATVRRRVASEAAALGTVKG